MSTRPQWEKMKSESPEAYAAFKHYRDTKAEDRSQELTAKFVGKSRRIIARWSSANDWVSRSEAFDAKRDSDFQAISKAIEENSARRHLEQAQRLQEIAMDELERIVDLSRRAEIPLIDPKTAVHMVVEGFKMERLVTGKTTENTEMVVSPKPLTSAEIIEHNRYITKMLKSGED